MLMVGALLPATRFGRKDPNLSHRHEDRFSDLSWWGDESPSEVGGDYYDVLQRDGRLVIALGDVTGHGMEAGMVMLMTQTAVRTLLESEQRNPVQFLDTLNRTIYNNVQRVDASRSLTLCVLDYADSEIQLAGQHDDPIVVRADGQGKLALWLPGIAAKGPFSIWVMSERIITLLVLRHTNRCLV